MREKQNNSISFRIFSSKFFLMLFLIIIIYLSISVYREIKQRIEVKKKISDLKLEIENLSKENNNLNDLIKYFETEEYIESASREKLGLKKPGEKIIVFTEDEDSLNLKSSKSKIESNNTSNIKLWWNYFFKKNKCL